MTCDKIREDLSRCFYSAVVDVAKFSWFLEGHLVLTSAFGGDWRTRYLNAAALRRVSLVLPVPTVVAGMLCHMCVVDHDNMIRTTAALQQLCLGKDCCCWPACSTAWDEWLMI